MQWSKTLKISFSNPVNLQFEKHVTRTTYVVYIYGAGWCLQRRIIWQSDKPADRQINSLPHCHRDLIVSLTEALVSHSIPTATGQYLSRQLEDVQILNNIFSLFLPSAFSSINSWATVFSSSSFFGWAHNSQTNMTAGKQQNGLTHQRERLRDVEEFSILNEPEQRAPIFCRHVSGPPRSSKCTVILLLWLLRHLYYCIGSA